jgi:AAA family ATP:ADP antiporter
MIYRIIRFLWGDLEREELKKFCLLAMGFFFLMGAWWPLKTLKDSIFLNLVGPMYQPLAKIASVMIFFPLVLLYSKLVDHFSKEKLIYFFIGMYGTIGLILVYFIAHPVIGLANTNAGAHRWIGWAFYFFCESFISLMLALYWSFINDITSPESAKKGYGLIAFGTQFGALLFTILGNYLSYDAEKYASTAPLIALISIGLFFVFGGIIFILSHVVKRESLVGYQTENKNEQQLHVDEKSVNFLEGLKLILTRPYVGGIFTLIFLSEFIATIMGFHQMLLAKAAYPNPGMLNKFFFDFNLCVQIIACLFAFIGTSFFHRKLGVRSSLITYPALLGLFIFSYIIHPTLQTIFYVMLISKALGYALYQPAKEMLYIPTSKNIKYKSKAWIDMFGLRFSKATGSGFNSIVGPLITVSGTCALGLIAAWMFIAGIVGARFRRAVKNNQLIE